MSDDDGFPSADSVTESDPVSDVDPEEMAKLIAEIGNSDDDNRSKNIHDSKKTNHGSKELSTKGGSTKETELKQKSDSDDDWDDDADDILKSDSEKPASRTKESKEAQNKPVQDFTQVKEELKTDNEIFDGSPKQDYTNATKLFQREESPELLLETSKGTPEGTTGKSDKTPASLTMKKNKEVSFEDNDNPLDLDNITSKTRSGKRAVDSGFMDSLLGKSTESKNENIKSNKDFSLPDKYKSTNFDNDDYKPQQNIGKYKPSTSGSPPKRNPSRATFSDSLEELFTTDTSKSRRGATPTRQKKPFEIDDDDILSSVKIKQGKEKESSSKTTKLESSDSKTTEAKNKTNDDWLFSGTPKQSPQKADLVSSSRGSAAPKGDDWLNQLLSTDKTSPAKKSNQNNPTSPLKNENSSTPLRSIVESSPNIKKATGTVGVSEKSMPIHQAQDHSQVSAMSAIVQAQQQQAENQMQYYQLQLHEQQKQMAQMLSQQSQIAMSNLPIFNSNQAFVVEDEEAIKKLKIDLHKASTESRSLEAELELLRKQHSQEIEIMEAAYKKKNELEKEVWSRIEENMREEREKLIENHNKKIREMQNDKEVLVSSYESNMTATKDEWLANLTRTKEMYSSVIDRMKKEHQYAVERLTELKNVELQALLSATGKAKEVEIVFDQLEVNTTNLSKLAACVQERNDSALQLSKKALELKEKQLKEIESQISVARAETESERNRLTVLISRLESNLANQGTEVESEKWKLSQERTKLEMEVKAVAEERKQFTILMEKERMELAKAKQNLWNEQREVMQNIMRQKSEISTALSQISNKNMNNFESEFILTRLNEEKSLLEEKIIALKIKKEELLEDEYQIEEKNLKLKEEQDKLNTTRSLLERERVYLDDKKGELKRTEEKLEEIRNENEKRMNEIIQATQNLHHLEDIIAKERSKLQHHEYEAMHFINQGRCPTCKSNAAQVSRSMSYVRMPGDGVEAIKIRDSSTIMNKKTWDPASVIERLRAARREETALREENLQRITAFNAKT